MSVEVLIYSDSCYRFVVTV